MRTTFLDKKDNKNSILKKTILRLCIESGEYSIAALSEQINTSVPTVTKLIGELMDEGFMIELGKSGTSGGRRPSIYGLNPEAGYFIGRGQYPLRPGDRRSLPAHHLPEHPRVLRQA